MRIDKAIRLFVDFINSSWPAISQLVVDRDYTTDEDSINDWLQANWELLVERKVLKLNEYLEVYGAGADFNGASSRITDVDALPTFKIMVKSKNDNLVLDFLNNESIRLDSVTFEQFVGFDNGFYKIEPDFKYALAIDNLDKERVVSLNDIEFHLEHL